MKISIKYQNNKYVFKREHFGRGGNFMIYSNVGKLSNIHMCIQ